MAALIVKRRPTKRTVESKSRKLVVPSVLSECPVTNAIHMLYSTGTMLENDAKASPGGLGVVPDQYEFSSSTLGALKGLFGPGKSYKFTCSANGKMTTTGGSVLAYGLGTQIINYLEYSALVALFNEVRLRSTRLTTVGLVGAGSALLGFKSDGLDAVTLSAASVSRLRNSTIVNCSSNCAPVTHVARCSSRGFTPMPEDYSVSKGGYSVGGTIGSWCITNNSVLAASTDELAYIISINVELRNRI